MKKQLLLNEQPLFVLPSLAERVGINEAILLQQLHYWLQVSTHKHEGRTWRYQTYEGWAEELPWMSPSGVRKLLNRLKENGLIITSQFNSNSFDKTLWYTIDYDTLFSETREFYTSDTNDKSSAPPASANVSLRDKGTAPECATIPNITTDITTDNMNNVINNKNCNLNNSNMFSSNSIYNSKSATNTQPMIPISKDKFDKYSIDQVELIGKERRKTEEIIIQYWSDFCDIGIIADKNRYNNTPVEQIDIYNAITNTYEDLLRVSDVNTDRITIEREVREVIVKAMKNYAEALQLPNSYAYKSNLHWFFTSPKGYPSFRDGAFDIDRYNGDRFNNGGKPKGRSMF